MRLGISARSGAPNDGTGKGDIQGYPNAYSRSKQNSDAGGLLYQGFRKDPFTFAMSSIKIGSDDWNYGKYPVKIYNGKRELIYQEDIGRDNTGMAPVRGMIYQSSPASSMMETIKKPNRFYGALNTAVVSQVGHSKELWDYYWTSYSRGTDGNNRKAAWHNTYLDGYIVLRPKSIYDPCPYGYRTPTNGTYNDFKSNPGWTGYSYAGGVNWNQYWIPSLGLRSTIYERSGSWLIYQSSLTASLNQVYRLLCEYGRSVYNNYHTLSQMYGVPLRCIEDATGKAGLMWNLYQKFVYLRSNPSYIKMKKILTAAVMAITLCGCGEKPQQTQNEEIVWQIDMFDDIKVLQYRVNGFDDLTPKEKELVYYLSQAALCGRDILFDQNFKYNMPIRKTLEAIYTNFNGDKNSEDWKNFEIYLKKVWFANGIHHHYSNDKFTPEFSEEFFKTQLATIDASKLPSKELLEMITKVIFDPTLYQKRLSQDASKDLVVNSAVNFYDGVSQKEVEDYYTSIVDPNDKEPISYGLNTFVTKENGKIVEKVYKVGGVYSKPIEQIVHWLEKAEKVAQNDHQARTIAKLVEYYQTGDLKKFDEYNILWVQDTLSSIDFVNGFIENYTDPLGLKATWESIVNFKDMEATKRTEIISKNAQWFEDNSPVAKQYKKPVVKGVSAKVITAAIIGGDCYPATPIGINLPNADWIRKEHGSKSVTIANFTHAYDKSAQGSGFGSEFYLTEIQDLIKTHGAKATDVEIDLHECLGHGSGQLAPGTKGDELKNYGSPLEETRAELFALYYIADNKMVELGVLESPEAYKAEYSKFIFNGLMGQLTRIKLGNNIEQAHMRSRQLIAKWAYELGKENNVIELIKVDGKTFVKINDYNALRTIFGTMLAEIQRIKSEGDYTGGKNLIETYAVSVDPDLHKEVLDRYAKLNIAPYSGFVNPVYMPVYNEAGEMTDVQISYPANYSQQHLLYSSDYSFL